LQRDSARGEACLLVLNRVTSRERNLDGWVVRGVTERGVTEQRLRFVMNNYTDARQTKITHIDELLPGRWASAGDTLLLAIGLYGTEALCADGLLIRHCAEFRSELGN